MINLVEKLPLVKVNNRYVPEIQLDKNSRLFLGYPLTIYRNFYGLETHSTKGVDYFTYTFKDKDNKKRYYELIFRKDTMVINHRNFDASLSIIREDKIKYQDLQNMIYDYYKPSHTLALKPKTKMICLGYLT